MKCYGRAPTFLMITGYEQVRSIAADIAGDREAAERVRAGPSRDGRVHARRCRRRCRRFRLLRRSGSRRGRRLLRAGRRRQGRRKDRLRVLLRRCRIVSCASFLSTGDDADPRLGFELLPSGHPRGSDRARPGISSNWFFAAFSGSLVISGLLGPRVGRQIDRVGGRQVPVGIQHHPCGAGLLSSGHRHRCGRRWQHGCSSVLGWGSACTTLHLAHWAASTATTPAARSQASRLIAGFASTVGWPLSSFGLDAIGWRGTCFAWAAAHISDRPSAQHVLSAEDSAATAEPRPSRQAAHSDRPHDVPAVVRLRGRLDSDVGHGRTSAADRGSVRRHARAGGVRRHDDRTGASGGARPGGQHAEQISTRCSRPGSPASRIRSVPASSGSSAAVPRRPSPCCTALETAS